MSKSKSTISMKEIINNALDIIASSGLDDFEVIVEDDVHESVDDFGVPKTQSVSYIILEDQGGIRLRAATIYDNSGYNYGEIAHFFASSPYLIHEFIEYIQQSSSYIASHKGDLELYQSRLAMIRFNADALRNSILEFEDQGGRQELLNMVDTIIGIVKEK